MSSDIELVGGIADGQVAPWPADLTTYRVASLPAVPAFDAPRGAVILPNVFVYRDSGRVRGGKRVFELERG